VLSLQQRRYPTLIVALDDDTPVTSTHVQEVVEECQLKHVDFRSDILCQSESDIVLGAYLRGHFLKWLIDTARGSGGLLVEKADEVIAAWPDAERRAFFMELLRTQCNDPEDSTRRCPIVLMTFHAARYALPTEEKGQGIVFNPLECEGRSNQ
jgi:hypothetical protein